MTGSHRAIKETTKARFAVAGALLLAPATGAAIVGAAVGLAAPAFADPAAPSGPFNYTGQFAGESSVRTAVWTFSDCGKECVTASSDKAWMQNWQFHLNNATWTADTTATVPCIAGGGDVPVTYTSTFDAATLTGQWTRTWNGACGNSQPGATEQQTFTLTQA